LAGLNLLGEVASALLGQLRLRRRLGGGRDGRRAKVHQRHDLLEAVEEVPRAPLHHLVGDLDAARRHVFAEGAGVANLHEGHQPAPIP
jgi:hypothetical protein